jgi:hypothetical protein
VIQYVRVLWFSSGTPVSFTNKTDRHDIPEILLKVALITIKIYQITSKLPIEYQCEHHVYSGLYIIARTSSGNIPLPVVYMQSLLI